MCLHIHTSTCLQKLQEILGNLPNILYLIPLRIIWTGCFDIWLGQWSASPSDSRSEYIPLRARVTGVCVPTIPDIVHKLWNLNSRLSGLCSACCPLSTYKVVNSVWVWEILSGHADHQVYHGNCSAKYLIGSAVVLDKGLKIDLNK